MDRIAAGHGIGHDMSAHPGGHGRKALGQRGMQRERLSLCLADQFGKEPVEQRIAFGGIGRAPTICRNDIFALHLQRNRRGQSIAGPSSGKDQVVRGRHPALTPRESEGVFDRSEKGLPASLTVLTSDARCIEARAKQIEQVLVLRRRVVDRAEARDNLAAESRAMQEIDAEPFEDFTSGAEPVAAGLREGRHCLVDPIFCHLSPAPAA